MEVNDKDFCGTGKFELQGLSMSELFNLTKLNNIEAEKILNQRLTLLELSAVRHLPGQHDQMKHGKGGGGGLVARPGMGDIPISDSMASVLSKDSAGPHLRKNAQGNWEFTPERQALHDKIVEDSVVGVPKSDDPTVHMLGGGPATGKTTWRESGELGVPKQRTGKAVDVNPDEYKKALPEYALTNEIDRAPFTHEESSYLSKRVTAAAMERQQDIVLDQVGDSGKTQAKIDVAHANGYKVNAVYLTRPTEISVQANLGRAAREGRVVRSSEVRKLHAGVSRDIPKVAKNFDSFKLYDTTERGSLKLLAQGGSGKLDIVDKAGYDSFLAKANEPVI